MKKFSMYTAPFSAIAANGGTDTKTLQINKAYDFTIIKLTCSANNAYAPVTESGRIVLSNVNIQITDTSSRYDWADAPFPVPNMFGTGEIPFILPTPYVLTGNSALSIVATNEDTTNAYNFTLSFMGYIEDAAG